MEKKDLRVLFIVSWYGPKGPSPTGGIFHYELVRELNKYCKCAIFYPYDRDSAIPFEKNIEWDIETYRSRYRLQDKVKNRVYMIKCMKYIVKTFKPNIIHGNVATEAGRFAVMLGRMFRIPVVISEHSSPDYSGVTSFPHHFYAQNVYKHSAYTTCVSDYVTKRLSELFPKYKFHTVYNGIIVPDSSTIQHGMYRKEGKVNFVIVAEIYDKEIKGLQFLLPAIKKLKDSGYDFVLHHVGGGDYLDIYINLAKELNIDDKIVFHGSFTKEQVYNLVSDMDFMVSASLVESFGCSIAEGAMFGCPAVVTRCGGLESIVDEETGIVVDKESEEALFGGLEKMLRDYHQYDRIKIKERAINKFSLDAVTQKYLSIYLDVLNNK